MKPTLRKTLMMLTMLSTGFFILSSETAVAGDFKIPKTKPFVEDPRGEQYSALGEAKDDINTAINLHQTAKTLLSDKEQLEKYKENIDMYYEIERRLKQNQQCNINLLNENFSDGAKIWKKVSAYAEDASAKLLAEASGSLGDSSVNMDELESKASSGELSGETNANSPYSKINENTTKEEASRLVSQGSSGAENTDTGMDIDEAVKYGKVRWDVGYSILKDIYTYPEKWGKLKKRFSPWVDQKQVYNVYLNNFYKEMEDNFVQPTNPFGVVTRSFPKRPHLSEKDSYLPQDHYNGKIPDVTVSNQKAGKTVDDAWCGSTNGKKNVCARVNKGTLLEQHQKYVKELQTFSRKSSAQLTFDAPYLPQTPLPPWREVAYIVNTLKQIPEIGSDLPDPWYRAAQNVENYAPNGELANLVEVHKKTLRYRPQDFDEATGEIKTDSKGRPRIPLPLDKNRISTYLALVSAYAEQGPIKDRSIASIKEMGERIITTLQKVGYTVPNAETFDLSKESDYNMTIQKLKELQDAKIASARAKIQSLYSARGGLMPSVRKMMDVEVKTMNALQKDSDFLVSVTRDNATDINSLLLTAVADITANENYKKNHTDKMKELSKVPVVGCPIL